MARWWQSLAFSQKLTPVFSYAVPLVALVIGVWGYYAHKPLWLSAVAFAVGAVSVALRGRKTQLQDERIQDIDNRMTGRRPTEEEWKRFKERLATIPPQVVSVLYVQTDKEAGQFAQLIADRLSETKWKANGPFGVPKKKAGTKTGIACLTLKKYEKPTWLRALREAFSEIGCTLEDGWDPDNIHDGSPEIYVAPRPQPAQTQTESKIQ